MTCRRNRRRGRPALLLALAVLGGALSACGGPGHTTTGADRVVIGVSAAQTGYLSSVDLGFIAGLKLAVAVINGAGGIRGHQIEIAEVLDEQSNPAVGVSNVNKLVNADEVDAVFAGGDSTTCDAAQSITTRNQVPMLCVAPPPAGSPYQFEVSSSVKRMVDTIMTHVHDQGIASVAYLGTTNIYGQLIGNLVKAAAGRKGIAVVASTTVAANATDLTATMQQLASANPGAVVDSLAGPAHILEAKGAAAAGLDVPLVMMSDSLDNFKQASAEYDHVSFVVQAPQAYPQIDDPDLKAAAEKFVDAYRATGEDENLLASAAYGWDAAHIFAEAVSQTDEMTGPRVQKALETMKYQGAVTLYQYSATDHTGAGSAANPYAIGSFRDGALVIDPAGSS